MKKIMNNKILQKIILSVAVVLTLWNVINPTIVAAKEEDYGVLFGPVQAASTGVGDALMTAVNLTVGGRMPAIITIEKSLGTKVLNAVIAVGAAGGMIIAGVSGHVEFIAPLAKGFVVAAGISWVAGEAGWTDLGDKVEIPYFPVTPETIFSGKVPLLDANIINPLYEDSAAYLLQTTIASWYNTFRIVAIVGLLSVLVYIAIRIILSAAAEDKAKYKTMLKDWFVGFCLLFFMHYIMAFSTTIIETITYIFPVDWYTVIKSSDGDVLSLDDLKDRYGGDAEEAITNLTWHTTGKIVENDSSYSYDGDSDDIAFNFMEYIRFKAQTTKYAKNDSILERFTYTLMYLVLAIYTIMFLFIYLKRLVYLIFLTMISPLVALTYPLDKVKDGSAQGFNTWLKEYMFNMMLQPLHLALYYVLIYSARDILVEHPIYAIIVLGMMLPVEKLLRKMFGFEKSSTAASLSGGLVGGAAMYGGLKMLTSGIKNLGKKGIHGSGGGGGKSEDNSESLNQSKFRGGKYNVLDALGGKKSSDDDGPIGPNDGGSPDGGGSFDGNGSTKTDADNSFDDNVVNVLGGGTTDNDGNVGQEDIGGIDFGKPLDIGNQDIDDMDEESDEYSNVFGQYYKDQDDYGSFADQDSFDYYNNPAQEALLATQRGNVLKQPYSTAKGNQSKAESKDSIKFRWAEDDVMSDDAKKWFRSPRYDNAHGDNLRRLYGAKDWLKKKDPMYYQKQLSGDHFEKLEQLYNMKKDGKLTDKQYINEVEKLKTIKNLKEGMENAKGTAKAVAAAANEMGINKESAGEFLKTTAGVLGGATLAATTGTVAAASAITSSEFGNLAKWVPSAGAAGGIAGYAAAKRAAGLPSAAYAKITSNGNNVRDAYIKEKYGKEEAQARINKRLNEEHMKNAKVKKMYQEAFKKDWEKAMQASLTYRNETGVTDNKLIINTMKAMQKDKKAFDDKDGLTTAKLAKNVKNRDDVRYMTEYLQRNGIDKNKIKNMEKYVLTVKELD